MGPEPQVASTSRQRTPRQSTSGQRTTGYRTTGRTTGQRTTGQRTTGQRTTGQRTTGQRTTGQRTTGQRTIGQRTTGQRATGQRATGQRTTGQRSTGQRSTGKRSTGQRSTGQRSTGQRATGQRTTRRRKTKQRIDRSYHQWWRLVKEKNLAPLTVKLPTGGLRPPSKRLRRMPHELSQYYHYLDDRYYLDDDEDSNDEEKVVNRSDLRMTIRRCPGTADEWKIVKRSEELKAHIHVDDSDSDYEADETSDDESISSGGSDDSVEFMDLDERMNNLFGKVNGESLDWSRKQIRFASKAAKMMCAIEVLKAKIKVVQGPYKWTRRH